MVYFNPDGYIDEGGWRARESFCPQCKHYHVAGTRCYEDPFKFPLGRKCSLCGKNTSHYISCFCKDLNFFCSDCSNEYKIGIGWGICPYCGEKRILRCRHGNESQP